ncbi:MAG: CpaF family protein [Acidimicrobiales bacterium]
MTAHLWGLGRLQALIDDHSIENVNINGCDQVWIIYADGLKVRGDPVADTNEELMWVAAARLGQHERRFDLGSPQLDLRLPDGTRLSAVMSVCERPSVSLRRHRHQDLTLDDLVGLGMLSPDLARWLAAAVRAGLNILVSGEQNVGKSTLLRALAAVIEPGERIVTVETALELGLDRQARHPDAVALEARPANVEGVGEVSMRSLVERTRRMNADRVIVGEVMGDEVVVMLSAMTQGGGGNMATVHADSSAGVFRRLATYAIQAREHLPIEATNLAVAEAIDLVVHVERRAARSGGGRGGLERFIASVREVVDAEGQVVHSNEVWRPGPDGRAVPGVPLTTKTLDALLDAGYRPARAWSAMRTVAGVSIAFVVLAAVARGFLAPYSSVGGQMVLGGVGACFALGLWLMSSMVRSRRPERFLHGSVGR